MISLCRTRPDAKPHPHACSPQHAAVVDDYKSARDAQLARAELETLGYRTELERWFAEHPRLTFKTWLLGVAR